MPDPSPAPIHGTRQGGSHDTMNLDVSFPAYVPPNHARISEWNSVLNLDAPMRPGASLSASEFGAISNPLAANSAPGRKQIIDHGVLAHLGTDLHLHAGIFWEEVAVDDEQPIQVNSGYGGGPFLSPGEGLLELLQAGSFPVNAVQQRVPDLFPVV
jgi:hypothetical protein